MNRSLLVQLGCCSFFGTLVLTAPVTAQALVPAGVINAALRGPDLLLVAPEPELLQRQAKAIANRLQPGAELITDQDAVARSLAGRTLLVYAAANSPFLAKHADRLPFRYGDGTVEVDGRRFEGKRLRVICAVRNPDDPARRAVLYTAATDGDLVGINVVNHGLTEWVVADGTTPLASGSFSSVALPVEALRADLDFVRDRIAAVHTAAIDGLPARVAAAVEAAAARLQGPLRRDQVWGWLAPVLASLDDAHSALAPLGSGDALALPFVWLQEGCIVDRDTDLLRKGDRIVALGGRSMAEVETLLRERVAAENVHWLRSQGEGLLRDPTVLRALGIAQQPPLTITLERDGVEREARVAIGQLPGGQPQPWVRFHVDTDRGLGVLTLDRCINDEEYRIALQRFFAAVREHEIPRIAVDLRQNSGGDSSVTTEFLRYLPVKEYKSFGATARWSEDAAQQRNQSAAGVQSYAPQTVPNEPHADAFAGEVFVLTGKRTFSSGRWFATVIRDNGIGKTVGEPTGSAPSAFGDALSFELPNSRLSFFLSFKNWVRPDPTRDPADTLEPDIPVPLQRQHVIDGTDPVLDHLRALSGG